MSDVSPEPGIGRHEWETRYEQLLPLLEDEPEETLPGLADLVEDMMEQSQLATDDEMLVPNTEHESLIEERRAER